MALDDICGAEIAASIEMLRDDNNKSMLIVEGRSDRKFFDKFYDREQCEIVIAYGKENALEAVRILVERDFPGILCVVDSDYDKLFLRVVANDNVIESDDHDVESMMLRSNALRAVVTEMGSGPKMAALQDSGRSIEDVILGLAVPLGIMRIYSIASGKNLRFKELEYKFIDKSGKMDEGAMVKKIHHHSEKPQANYDAESKYIGFVREAHGEHWGMCCGHDLTSILGRLLQGVIGSHNSTTASKEEIESRLRLAYDRDDFRMTKLFRGIREWETRNGPYKVLLAAI